MITDREIRAFWNRWDLIMISWFLVSALGLLSTAVVWAFVLKHYCGVKTKFWLLNDTVDGDYGAEWWLEQKGWKPGLWSAFNWWFRNHSWNYICKFSPAWEGGNAQERRLIRSTLDPAQHHFFTWCSKDGVHGLHYVAYRINGNVYCRYSQANHKRERIFGAGGDRYKLKIR